MEGGARVWYISVIVSAKELGPHPRPVASAYLLYYFRRPFRIALESDPHDRMRDALEKDDGRKKDEVTERGSANRKACKER